MDTDMNQELVAIKIYNWAMEAAKAIRYFPLLDAPPHQEKANKLLKEARTLGLLEE